MFYGSKILFIRWKFPFRIPFYASFVCMQFIASFSILQKVDRIWWPPEWLVKVAAKRVQIDIATFFYVLHMVWILRCRHTFTFHHCGSFVKSFCCSNRCACDKNNKTINCNVQLQTSSAHAEYKQCNRIVTGTPLCVSHSLVDLTTPRRGRSFSIQML